jgi:diguanylate cyclase (GGDEF)-like protein
MPTTDATTTDATTAVGIRRRILRPTIAGLAAVGAASLAAHIVAPALGGLLSAAMPLCATLVGLVAVGGLVVRPLARTLAADVAGQAETIALLERIAGEDPLTGLANRRHFETTLALACRRAVATGRAPGLLLVDLDGFKTLNDALGHAAGDAALGHVARTLAGVVPGDGVAARIGGDEFAVLLPSGTTAADAIALARAIVAALDAPFAWEGRTIAVGASVGAAFGDDPSTLTRRADEALYRAKGAGRGRAVLAGPVGDGGEASRTADAADDARVPDMGERRSLRARRAPSNACDAVAVPRAA